MNEHAFSSPHTHLDRNDPKYEHTNPLSPHPVSSCLFGLADLPQVVGPVDGIEVRRHAQALQRLPGLLLPAFHVDIC